MRRSGGRPARVALYHSGLHLYRAAHGVNRAAELYEDSVAGALDHAPVVHGDGRINQIAAERPEPRQCAILVRSRKSTISDNVRS